MTDKEPLPYKIPRVTFLGASGAFALYATQFDGKPSYVLVILGAICWVCWFVLFRHKVEYE